MQEESSPKLIFKSLTKKRKEKGWGLEYVARHLHLTPSCVQHLEQADFDDIPRGPYYIGYLRSYCELLDIDPEPFTAVYRSLKPSTPSLVFQQPMMSRMKLSPQYEHKKHKTFYGLACAFILFAFASLVTSQTLMRDNDNLVANAEDTQSPPKKRPDQTISSAAIDSRAKAGTNTDEGNDHFQSL